MDGIFIKYLMLLNLIEEAQESGDWQNVCRIVKLWRNDLCENIAEYKEFFQSDKLDDIPEEFFRKLFQMPDWENLRK